MLSMLQTRMISEIMVTEKRKDEEESTRLILKSRGIITHVIN